MRLARCATRSLTGQQVHGRKRLLALAVGILAALLAAPAAAVRRPGQRQHAQGLPGPAARLRGQRRPQPGLQGQEAQLEKQIGGDDIYLVVAASGSSGYNASMDQIISDLNGHSQFTVGFLDSRLKHFGAYNKGMLPAHGAADIATRAVEQHRADQDVFAALTDFVTDVQQEAGSARTAPRPTRRRTRCATS